MDNHSNFLNARAKLASYLDDLEAKRLEFVEAVKNWAPHWWESHARHLVCKEIETTDRLSDAELRRFKSELRSVWDREQQRIDTILKDGFVTRDEYTPQVWWHLSGTADDLITFHSRHNVEPPRIHGDFYPMDSWDDDSVWCMLGRVLGCAIPTFQKFGYETWLRPFRTTGRSSEPSYGLSAFQHDIQHDKTPQLEEVRRILEDYSGMRDQASRWLSAAVHYRVIDNQQAALARWDRIDPIDSCWNLADEDLDFLVVPGAQRGL